MPRFKPAAQVFDLIPAGAPDFSRARRHRNDCRAGFVEAQFVFKRGDGDSGKERREEPVPARLPREHQLLPPQPIGEYREAKRQTPFPFRSPAVRARPRFREQHPAAARAARFKPFVAGQRVRAGCAERQGMRRLPAAEAGIRAGKDAQRAVQRSADGVRRATRERAKRAGKTGQTHAISMARVAAKYALLIEADRNLPMFECQTCPCLNVKPARVGNANTPVSGMPTRPCQECQHARVRNANTPVSGMPRYPAGNVRVL